MKKQLATWELISKSLQEDVPVMLLYVLQSDGSSPGRQGFFMAVNEQEAAGSIGGGIMEFKFTEMAREQLSLGHDALSLRRQVHDKSSPRDQSGMICSGEQTILIYRVQPSDAAVITQIIRCIKAFETGVLQLSPAGIHFTPQLMAAYSFTKESPENWLYTEQLGYTEHLYLIGGGHCALACSRIMSMLDFYIHVFDNRPLLHTLMENDIAHEKVIVEDYGSLTTLIPEGPQHYVVVMTMGYRSDDMVVRALIGKHFRYIGLLGSQAKISKMFSTYREEGLPQQWLELIHAPVGLPVKSRTPEEIAVSIAAEIIQERNRYK